MMHYGFGMERLRHFESGIRRRLRHFHGTLVDRHYASLASGRQAAWTRIQSQGTALPVDLGSGVRIVLFLDSGLSKELFLGYFELNEVSFVRTYLLPGDVFVDVGANVGVYTVVASQKVGERGRVYSFEPTPRTFRNLTETVRINGLDNVVCCQMGLSDTPGSLDLKMSVGGLDAWNSFGTPARDGTFVSEAVNVTTFRHYACEAGLRPGDVALMKIDVEGWEERVLLGASDFLAHPNGPALVVETNDVAAQSAGSSPEAILQALKNFGYSVYRFDRLRRDLQELEEDPLGLSNGNLIAVKRPDVLRRRLGGRGSWRFKRSGHGLW